MNVLYSANFEFEYWQLFLNTILEFIYWNIFFDTYIFK